MKSHLVLSVGLALALTAPAFAHGSPSSMQASAPNDQTAPAESQSTTSDSQQQPADSQHRHRKHPQGGQQYNPAAEALTGNEPGTVAYWDSDRQKTYPAVDHGHVPGDPPIIDHSDDHAAVAHPTTTTITIPPN